jgi:hypothetical protein
MYEIRKRRNTNVAKIQTTIHKNELQIQGTQKNKKNVENMENSDGEGRYE